MPDTGRFTTPESAQVQEMLSRMVDAGCEWAVIEATSHGLALHRVDEYDYDIAAFTTWASTTSTSTERWRTTATRRAGYSNCWYRGADKGIEKTAVLNSDDERRGSTSAAGRRSPAC